MAKSSRLLSALAAEKGVDVKKVLQKRKAKESSRKARRAGLPDTRSLKKPAQQQQQQKKSKKKQPQAEDVELESDDEDEEWEEEEEEDSDDSMGGLIDDEAEEGDSDEEESDEEGKVSAAHCRSYHTSPGC
jgi:rRNA-processing protein EBP2